MSRTLAAAEMEPACWIASSRSALPGPKAISSSSSRRRRTWPRRLMGTTPARSGSWRTAYIKPVLRGLPPPASGAMDFRGIAVFEQTFGRIEQTLLRRQQLAHLGIELGGMFEQMIGLAARRDPL